MQRLILILFFSLAWSYSQAQTPAADTIAELPTATVLADRQQAFGQGSRQWDGALESLPIHIKTYGPGQLGSLSLRGASAAHTALIWNGFNLQNPMHGQVDFSLLPTLLFPEVRVDLGASAALWGSGAIGGAVHLKSPVPVFQSGHQLEGGMQVGSFRQRAQVLAWAWGGAHLRTQTRLFRVRQQNDFSYMDLMGVAQRQSHAAVRQMGGTQDFWFQKKKHQLDAHIWIQGVERKIPPTLLQSQAQASQTDQSARVALHWGYSHNEWALHLRSALLHDVIGYLDPVAGLEDWSNSQVLSSEGEWQWAPKPFQLFAIGFHHSWLWGSTNYYEEPPLQMRQAVFSSYRLESPEKKWMGTISLRQEWNRDELAPLSPAIHGSWQALPWLRARLQFSRHFRWPTMNDLYWLPGGNPGLQAEKGWGGEWGLKGTGKLKALHWEWELSGYTRRIQDWILWRPKGSYWSPQNLALVWSRGWEGSLKAVYPLGPIYLDGSISYAGVWSTSLKKLSPNDNSVGKQLIYTPVHKLTGQMAGSWENLALAWSPSFTGKVYTLADHSDSLPGFWTHDIHLEYKFNKDRLSLLIFSDLNNIFNTSYQLVQHRPMPGRSLVLGFTLKEKFIQ